MRTIEGQDGLTEIEIFTGPEQYLVTSSYDKRVFADILFQAGPVKERGPNGCFVEDLLKIVIDRLERYQKGKLSCAETMLALGCCKLALKWLGDRAADRKARGVEGKEEQ